MKARVRVLAVVALAGTVLSVPSRAARIPFTVAKEIGLWHFNSSNGSTAAPIASPNGRFIAIWAERGLINDNLVEDELRVYSMTALKQFVLHPDQRQPPAPIVDLRESTYSQGPIISEIRWLRDSSGVAFLLRSADDKGQLTLMSLKGAHPRVLSLKNQNVITFDVRDATHYAYTAVDPSGLSRPATRNRRASWDATGNSIASILMPREWNALINDVGIDSGGRLRGVLWAALGGEPRQVQDNGRQPIVVYPDAGSSLALSPNGYTLATVLPVRDVPRDWVREFRPPYANDPYDIMQAGQQKLAGPIGDQLIKEYVLINLRTGAITPIRMAPTGSSTGWYTLVTGKIAWSDDGQALLLSDAYVQRQRMSPPLRRPCVAAFYPATDRMQCVESLSLALITKGVPAAGSVAVTGLRFADHGSDRVILRYIRYSARRNQWTKSAKSCVRAGTGAWSCAQFERSSQLSKAPLDVYVSQGLNQPQVVMARDSSTKYLRVIWDPNPQLKNIALGRAAIYHWRDATGREWTGGLYTPANYIVGQHYPLVIQTHGFPDRQFRPSGIFPTAFAARALAASGMVVLQAPMCPTVQNPESGPCEVEDYDAAVRQLASQGVIDPNRIGIIGFSYTVYTVLETLTTSPLRFAAASISDGWNYGYWDYLTLVDSGDDAYARASDAMVGAKPFGAGLRLWLKRAPDFNMQNVHTPLLVTSNGRLSLLDGMWEPYALLRYLHKPVDLVLFHSDEHVLTNPAVRLASQGGSVDWFRFWLEGYESAHPVMAGEYRRWEKLCDMQIEESPGHSTWCVPTKGFLARHPVTVRPAVH